MEFIFKKPIIARTGSPSKRLVKMLIAIMPKQQWIIFQLKDDDNTYQNTLQHENKISLIHLDNTLEYEMEDEGDITRYFQMLQPNISIMTTLYKKLIQVINPGTIILGQGRSSLNICHIVSLLYDQYKTE